MTRKLMTAREVTQVLNISRAELKAAIARGDIPRPIAMWRTHDVLRALLALNEDTKPEAAHPRWSRAEW